MKLLLTLIFSICVTAQSFAEEVALFIVYHSATDSGQLHLDSHTLLARGLSNKISKIDENIVVKFVFADSRSTLQSELSSQLVPEDTIKYLFFASHGNTLHGPAELNNGSKIRDDEIYSRMGPKTKTDERISLVYHPDDAYDLDEIIERNQQAIESLVFLRGRFSDDPTIIIPGCKVICEETTLQQAYIRTLSTVLGVPSGSYFGLSSLGQFPLLLKELPWKLTKGSLTQKLAIVHYGFLGLFGGLSLILFGADHPIFGGVAAAIGVAPVSLFLAMNTSTRNFGYWVDFSNGEIIKSQRMKYFQAKSKIISQCRRLLTN